MTKSKSEQLADDDLVYYTHPSGKVEEMTRTEAAKLEKKEGGSTSPAPEQEPAK
jgi:hypothetical protein